MKIILMLYVSRSGSTLLSNRIAKAASNILVLPEIDILEVLMNIGSNVVNMKTSSVAKLLSSDPRWKNIKISNEVLLKIIDKHKRHGVANIFLGILEYLQEKSGRRTDYVLIKKGSNLYRVPEIKNLFKDITIIHIYRDPRAVANSLLSNERPNRPGYIMGRGDPVYIARQWSRYTNKAELVSDVSVRFEDLIVNEESVVQRILKVIGLDYTLKSSDFSNLPYINKKERGGIHKLVSRKADLERVSGWKGEIDNKTLEIVNMFCEVQMKKLGYRGESSQPNLSRKNFLLVISILKSLLYKIGLFRMYIQKNGWLYLLNKAKGYIKRTNKKLLK